MHVLENRSWSIVVVVRLLGDIPRECGMGCVGIKYVDKTNLLPQQTWSQYIIPIILSLTMATHLERGSGHVRFSITVSDSMIKGDLQGYGYELQGVHKPVWCLSEATLHMRYMVHVYLRV